MLRRTAPRYISTPRSTAVARPRRAPMTGAVVVPDERMPAQRKSAVSTPSRVTAANATAATATPLAAKARSISPCRCCLMPLARDAIQNTIHVMRHTATTDIAPANAVAALSLRASLMKVSTSPTPTETPIAIPTPSQAIRTARRSPALTR